MSTPRHGGPGTVTGMLTLEELRAEAESGAIDTVVTAFTAEIAVRTRFLPG